VSGRSTAAAHGATRHGDRGHCRRGGVWILLAGALRHYRGVNETISSLLLNYIAIAFMNHLVEGPMRDAEFVTKPSSAELSEALWMGTLPGSRIHYGLVYGLIACVLAYVLIQRTTFGFASRTAGGNIRAAKIAGLPVGKLTLAVCFLGGSCAGLSGHDRGRRCAKANQ
jgi:ABC-type uncharacterized transport system permease subunit